tara:strand:+ start:568 stop:888 length:321 start_codon:yes stop_codon:yes gene_type:complete
MIPFIRSITELMALTEAREIRQDKSTNNLLDSSTVDSGQRKRYIRSLEKKEVNLPDLPKTIKREWINNKKAVSKFFDDLDYNNQIQSSYDITLLARQNKTSQKDAA